MAKLPRAGRVKSRLGREIGMTAAAWWCRHQIRRLLRDLADPRWELILATTPDHAADPCWPAVPRIPQGRGDLGQRMTRLLRSLPPGPVLIVGSDIPGLAPRHIARAFRRLARAEAVIGPAQDGGYWALGMRGPRALPADLLDGIRWSTRYALTDTLLALSGYRTAFADTLSDVDRAADMTRAPRQNRMVRSRRAW